MAEVAGSSLVRPSTISYPASLPFPYPKLFNLSIRMLNITIYSYYNPYDFTLTVTSMRSVGSKAWVIGHLFVYTANSLLLYIIIYLVQWPHRNWKVAEPWWCSHCVSNCRHCVDFTDDQLCRHYTAKCYQWRLQSLGLVGDWWNRSLLCICLVG